MFLLDDMKWWHIIVMVIAAILCLIGVVLWITVGAVATNPPDDSKRILTSPSKAPRFSLNWTTGNSSDNVDKTTPTHKYKYSFTLLPSLVFFICVNMNNSNVSFIT